MGRVFAFRKKNWKGHILILQMPKLQFSQSTLLLEDDIIKYLQKKPQRKPKPKQMEIAKTGNQMS